MDFIPWLSLHGFTLLQSIGIVGGLLFTGLSLRIDTKVRRVSTLITITQQHRDIWTQLYRRPEMARIVDPSVDVARQPVSSEEELLVTLLVLHLNSAYRAMEQGMFVRPQGLRNDIARFFALPIPRAVWAKIRSLQDEDFVRFIEASWMD